MSNVSRRAVPQPAAQSTPAASAGALPPDELQTVRHSQRRLPPVIELARDIYIACIAAGTCHGRTHEHVASQSVMQAEAFFSSPEVQQALTQE